MNLNILASVFATVHLSCHYLLVRSFVPNSEQKPSGHAQKISIYTHLSKAFRRTRQAVDFPLPDGPTIIKPWFNLHIWYSWRTCI